jgi:hypothetical protein
MEPLIFKDNKAVAANGDVGVVMLVVSGESIDENDIKFRYFECVVRFFQPPTRVEWDADSMDAVLPVETADYLIKQGYARAMTKAEVRAYNNGLDNQETESPSLKLKKGDRE